MKGMSKRVSLKEQEVVQIYIFPNEEGAWHSCRKRQRALVIQALLWLATGTQQSQRSSGAEQHFLGSVPTGIKGLVGRVSWNITETVAPGGDTKESRSMTLLQIVGKHSGRGEVWKLGKGRKEDATCAHLLLREICRITCKRPGPRGQCLKNCQQQ